MGSNYMRMLEEQLGRALRPQELADFLGVDEKTVRQYYVELGGIRLGRLYVFFEQEVINAIQASRQMDSLGKEKRKEEGGDLQDRKGGLELGGRLEKKTHRRVGKHRDSHGLLSN